MSLLNQEAILREISLALHQRKRLNGQVSKLASELTTLERTSATAASALLPLRPTSSAHLLQPNFTSPVPPQNGLLPPQTTLTSQSASQQTVTQQPQSSSRGQPSQAQMPTTTTTTVQPQQHHQHPQRKSASSGSIRRSQEWPDIPEIGKIEEKNPEILAKKILETGRQIEAVKYGTELTPRVQQNAGGGGGQQLESKNNRKVPPMKLQRVPSASKPSSVVPAAAPSASTNKSAVHSGDTTPRVNDFEDRLKNLITSVLNDNSSPSPASTSSPVPPPISEGLKQQFAVPEREGLFARAPSKSSFANQHVQQLHVQSQPDYTQFSPAKLALRRHLSQERLHSPHKQPCESGYARTIGDLVTGEIERSLELSSAGQSARERTYSPISRPGSTDDTKDGGMPHSASAIAPVTAEQGECVEGLAASLRDSLRTPAEETQEREPHPTENEELTPSKKKRPSTDSLGEPAKKNAKWQDKITVRFDRMMAFASTEMDKRRRSTESCSPRTEPFSSPRGKDSTAAPTASNNTSKEPTPVREPEIKVPVEQPSVKQSSSSSSIVSDEPAPRKEKHRESSSKSDKKRDKTSDHDKSSK